MLQPQAILSLTISATYTILSHTAILAILQFTKIKYTHTDSQAYSKNTWPHVFISDAKTRPPPPPPFHIHIQKACVTNVMLTNIEVTGSSDLNTD